MISKTSGQILYTTNYYIKQLKAPSAIKSEWVSIQNSMNWFTVHVDIQFFPF